MWFCFLSKAHMLAIIVSPLDYLCIPAPAESKYIINSYKLYKWDIRNMIMPMLKVVLVIWIIAFICLRRDSS